MDPCGTPEVNGAGEVFHNFYDKFFTKLVCEYVTQVHIQKIQNSMFYFHNRLGV